MKTKIRYNMFETNSSSTHSLTVNGTNIEDFAYDLYEELKYADSKNELYAALGKLEQLKSIILKGINQINDEEEDY